MVIEATRAVVAAVLLLGAPAARGCCRRRVQGRVRRLACCPRAGQLSGACAAGVPRFRMHRPRHASDRAPAKFTGGLQCWPRFGVRARRGSPSCAGPAASSATRPQGCPLHHVAELGPFFGLGHDLGFPCCGPLCGPEGAARGQEGATGDARSPTQPSGPFRFPPAPLAVRTCVGSVQPWLWLPAAR